MKTTDLYLEYARVIKMCEGTALEDKPWECVKLGCKTPFGNQHPIFNCAPTDYKFAVAILEDKAVFIGNTIYSKTTGCPYTVARRRFHEIFPDISYRNCDMTWQPPSPTRTFDLNGVELSCPVKRNTKYFIDIGGEYFYFDNADDYIAVAETINSLLTEARDKG